MGSDMLEQVEGLEQIVHPLLLGQPTGEEDQRRVGGHSQLGPDQRRIDGGGLLVADARRDEASFSAGCPRSR